MDDSAADEPAAETSDDDPSPVSGAAVKQDWFSPTTETRLVLPDGDPAPADAATETRLVVPDGDSAPAEAATETEATTEAESGTAATTESGTEAAENETEAATEAVSETETAAEAEPELDAEAGQDHVDLPATDSAFVGAVSRTGMGGFRTPTLHLPVLNADPADVKPAPRSKEPEQVLADYPWKFDPVTLRELVDDPEQLERVRERLTDKLEYAERDAVRARLLSLRAVVSRVLGDLDSALADGQEALRHAEATGEPRRTSIVQARLAHVQQWRGDFGEADRLFEEANSDELPSRLRSEIHVQAGRSGYEQGRYLEAINHFEAALALRRVEDPGLFERVETSLDAVMARVEESGWGPYPRPREEVLQQTRPPHPTLNYENGLLGYADSDGHVVVTEQFADAQPFHEGAAWVRRLGADTWELIDETGTLLIDSASGYVQAGRFSDGLAWVSREHDGGLFAVDWHNRVIVPGGFADARPFRHGIAAVRRGGWGAIDRHGRVVVQTKFRGFATQLTAAGKVDGFTADGIAVVDAGDRLGVVDRTGQFLVAPVHAKLLIHPVAFLIGDREGRWGALDRHGDPVVEVEHDNPGDVMDAIEGLLSDTRPVL